MKKITLIIGAIVLFNIFSFGQIDTSSKVEVILKLVEWTDSDGTIIKHLGLSESIINHTDEYVYVPIINPTSTVSVLGLDSNKWYRLDPWGYLIKPGVYHPMIGSIPSEENWQWYSSMNRSYRKILALSDSIGKQYFPAHPAYKKASYYSMIYLKPGEAKNDYYTDDEDGFLKGSHEYKILILNDKKNIPENIPEFPTEILGYKYYDPTKITSNTIYFTSKRM
jgi:hypothetical protein